MMKIELLSHGKFTTSGSSVLKMMQNNSIPSLDLVIRESVQNSMDAGLPNQEKVIMNFLYNDFSVEMLAPHFESIGDNLVSKFGKTTQKFLAIQDKNTFGLTGNLSGDFKPGEKNQNLGKLVFHIMKPQDKEGAGGSWGIGKTVYYRIGIGLVIYYSRVKLDDGHFQERLVAALVENENNQNGLLSSIPNSLGVAFFGDLLKDNKTVSTIIDEKRIHQFLEIFHISPYSGTNTGTTIIIPFIDKDKLLSSNVTEGENKKWWENDVEQYLKVSLLRWYFPRISENYPKKYGPGLIVSINQNVLHVDKDTPIFGKFIELYNACYSDTFEPWIHKSEITKLRNLEDKVLGYFVYGKVNKAELRMISSHLPSPYRYCLLDEDDSDKHSPIIAFTRKPGMIVNYDTEGLAVGNIKSESDEYIIGVFSLNSFNKITKPAQLNLDEYIRQSEKSDHTSWADHEITANSSRVLIVKKIYQEISKELNNSYSEVKVTTGEVSINKNFAKKFGKLLLPDESFGKAGSGRTQSSKGGRCGGGALSTKKQNKIEFVERKFENNAIVLEYKITLKKPVKRIIANNCINTINGTIKPEVYEKMGLVYPCEIEKMFYFIELYDKKSVKEGIKIIEDKSELKGYSLSYLKTPNGKKCGFLLEKTIKNPLPIVFTIRLRIKTFDTLISTYFDFDLEEDDLYE